MADTPITPVSRPNTATRARLSAAGVIAQYIKDLSNPGEPVPCAA